MGGGVGYGKATMLNHYIYGYGGALAETNRFGKMIIYMTGIVNVLHIFVSFFHI